MTAIALSNLRYQYPRHGFTLTCKSLKLPADQLTLITGPNGSGKTTLVRVICGILRPYQGQVQIWGKETREQSLGDIGGLIGYLFQDPARQLFATTVEQEMTFIADLQGQSSELSNQKARELLEWFGLIKYKERSVFSLSRGEKQRLALCTMLMGDAKFFILDEPTTGLDRLNREKLYQLLDNLLALGKGFAIISHDLEFTRRFACHKVVVRGGQVVV